MTSIPSTGEGTTVALEAAAQNLDGVNSIASIPPGDGAGEGSAALERNSVAVTLAGDGSEGEKRLGADGFHGVSVTEKMEKDDFAADADSTIEMFEGATETLTPPDGGDQDIDGEEEKVSIQKQLKSMGTDAVGFQNATEEAVKEDLGGKEEEVANPPENTNFKADSSAASNPMVVGRESLDLNGKGEELPNEDMEIDVEPLVVDRNDGVHEPVNDQKVRYHLPTEEENVGFSATDMVWGKIKSHPWWPGQIFDQKYASDLALKHQKKDHTFLVAYFRDKTFAWCEESQLKPFQPCFAQMERQSGIEAFACAVDDALEEVSRRVELCMSCHCKADETFSDLEHKEVDNAGIREGTCCAVVNRRSFVDYFAPERLLDYIKALACNPLGGVDRLELTMATAQIKAFYRSKGVLELAVFDNGESLVEIGEEEVTPLNSKKSAKTKAHSLVSGSSNVLSGEKRSRGRPRKLQSLLADGNSVADVSTVRSGKKKSGGRPQKLQDFSEDGKAAAVESTVSSGKKKSRGRPRKHQDAMEDGKSVSDGSAEIHQQQNFSEDGKAAAVESTVSSGKKKSGGRPQKHQDFSEDGKAAAVESTVSSGKKKSRGRPRKHQDAMEDGKAVSDGSAGISGKMGPIIKARKLQAAAGGEKVVGNDSASLSGKKRGRGRPPKAQNVLDDDVVRVSIGKVDVSRVKSNPRVSAKKQRDADFYYDDDDFDDDDDDGRRGRKKSPDYSDKESPSSSRKAAKIGERTRRVASQVQEGSPSVPKSSIEDLQSSVAKAISSADYPSAEEMLSQLCLAARDPMRGYSFVSTIVTFFTYFKSLNSSKEQRPSLKPAGGKRGRKKKVVDSESDMSDSPIVDPYWSDRRLLLDSSPETEPVSKGRKRKKATKGKKQNKNTKSAGESQLDNPLDPLVDVEQRLPVNTSTNEEREPTVEKSEPVEKTEGPGGPRDDSVGTVDEFSPTALILSFNEADALPSAAELIEIFSPYGPLEEAETEVLPKTNRAKVVFKCQNDAETAFSSAGKFSVFGPALVSYRLRYLHPSSKAFQGNSPEDKKGAQVTSPEDKEDVISQSLPTASQPNSPEEKKDAMVTEVAQEDTVVASDNT